MRIPFLSMFITSPFNDLQEHAEKVKECSWAFQQAVECHASSRCDTFEELRQEVSRFENEADAIKRRIRGHLPRFIHHQNCCLATGITPGYLSPYTRASACY